MYKGVSAHTACAVLDLAVSAGKFNLLYTVNLGNPAYGSGSMTRDPLFLEM